MRFKGKLLSAALAVTLVFSITAPASAMAESHSYNAEGADGLAAAPCGDGRAVDGGQAFRQAAVLHVPLLQGGDYPAASQLGSAWDGIARDGGVLSAQASAVEQFEAALLDVLEHHGSALDVSRYGYYMGYNEDDLLDLYASVVNSHPELFYVGTAFNIEFSRFSRKISTLYPEYAYDEAASTAMRESYEGKVAEMLSWVPANGTVAQKMKAVHDYIATYCVYDDNAASVSDTDQVGWGPWNAYGALVDRQAVCQGYALAFRDAMNRLGIPSTYLAANDHAWNCANMDSNWYHIDVTWDDNNDEDAASAPGSDYFVKSDEMVAYLDLYRYGGELVHSGWDDRQVRAADTSYDGKEDWETYTGALSPVRATWFELSSETIGLKFDESAQLGIVNLYPKNGLADTPAWSTSDASVATVSSTGLVKAGHRAGAATITCALNGIERTCEVSAVEPDPIAPANEASAVEPDPIALSDADVSLSASAFAYTGKAIEPSVAVSKGGKELARGTDFDVAFSDNVNAGLATAVITGTGSYKGTVSKSFSITKAANPLKVKASTKTVKKAKLKKKAQSVKAVSFTRKAQGKVTYSKVSKGSSKRLSVNKKTGKVTVRKGSGRGTYAIKVKVSAAGTANYKAGSKIVTAKVKVR